MSPARPDRAGAAGHATAVATGRFALAPFARRPWTSALALLALVAAAFTWSMWPDSPSDRSDAQVLKQLTSLSRQIAQDPRKVQSLPAGVRSSYEPLGQGADVLSGQLYRPLSGGRCAVVDVAMGRQWFATGASEAVRVSGPTVTRSCPQS